MSKPVSNAEIEDVLTSIRRLVSENATAQRRDRPGADNRDRLVLTPAFRISEAEEPDADADVAETEATDHEGADDAMPPVESRADDVDAAVAILAERLAAARIIPETAPAPDRADTDIAEADIAGTSAAHSDAAARDAADTGKDAPESAEDAVADAIAQAAEDRSLELRIAELEAAVDNTADEWEPDGSEAQDIPDEVIFHHHAAARTGRTPEPEPLARPTDAPGEAAVPDKAATDAPEPREDQTAAAPASDPATDLDVDLTADASDWEDVMVSRPDDAHAFGGDDVDDAEVLEEESVIDEAILRDYVAQLVREELQGPIGERITHNVRRMVRREIARALALRDMD